jgi:ABC-type branched-subunit amino acid transport system ATPase component
MERSTCAEMLEVNNLKRYFGGVKAVDNCSFLVREKTITALIGPNGAGKSTVFNLISGILKAESGSITFENKNLTNMTPEKISNNGISRLFQQSRLFDNLTIKENLLLALDNEDTLFFKNLFGRNKVTKEKEEKVTNILKLVQMDRFINSSAQDLSYGQKRLIELTRTILNPHKFLMLDEPVAGVNPKLRVLIADILLKLKEEGETFLLIEHDMNFTLSIADKVIVMDEGRVIAEGSPEEIRNNSIVMEAYLGA